MILRGIRPLGPSGLGDQAPVSLAAAGGPDAVEVPNGILSPGWIDLHAHLREPGDEHKETLHSGAAAAAAGGFTQVVAMANTRPAIDTADRLRAQVVRATRLPIRVHFVGALTRGLEGHELTDAGALKEAGAVALSDDGRHAMSAATLELGLARATAAGLPVLVHPLYETAERSADDEARAVREAIDATRRVPGARLHLQHVSALRSIQHVREAKAAGLNVTAEATPHHLSLTADDVATLGADGAVNPPLRTARDRDACVEALSDGTIDVIATDHAPHDPGAKARGAFGFCGFETAVAVVLSLGLDWAVVYRSCVARPAEILGIGRLDDWILIDPQGLWTVDPQRFHSRGRNTPFRGRTLRGRVCMTVARDHVIHAEGALVA